MTSSALETMRAQRDAIALPDGRKLFPAHRDELHASGLTDDAYLARAGVYSETDQRTIGALLCWDKPPSRMGAAMVFCYVGQHGANGYARLKPDRPRKRDGKQVKYEQPRSRKLEPYFPPDTRQALSDPTVALLITEGEKKALCADFNKIPCVGLAGTSAWKPKKQERLLPALEQVAWKGRKVYIAFDNDLAAKPETRAETREMEARLAAVLTRHGAIVKCIRFPDDPESKKVGLDDFVVKHGVGELHRLICEAVDPETPEGIEMRCPASEVDPCNSVQAIIEGMSVEGASKLAYWRGSFWRWRHGRYIEQPGEEIRALLVKRLNESTCMLTKSVVVNHLLQLESQTMISGERQPPAWLGDRPAQWPPSEVLACKSELVHLPSYLASASDYRIPATPRFFTTSATDCNFDPNAGTPSQWLEFLSQLWPTDADAVDLLREWMGYCLLPDTSMQKILLMVGPRRAGKGTIARTLAALLGVENVAWPSMQTLGRPFGAAALLGKTLVVVGDAKVGGRDEATVASARLVGISGEDPQECDRKSKPSITCRLPTRLMVLTNEIPKLPDPSGALESRYLVLRFTKTFVGQEDRELESKLKAELPAILLWSITGWRRLRERGHFVEPEASAEIHEQAADVGSPVGQFVRERCTTDNPASSIAREDLYAAFHDWAKHVGRDHVPDNAEFGRQLRAAVPTLGTPQAPRHVKGFGGNNVCDKDGRSVKKRVYVGIELAPETF